MRKSPPTQRLVAVRRLQIVGQGQVSALLKSLFQRWNVSYGLIQFHALYPVEWIEDRRQTALFLRTPLLEPFIKSIQVQSVNGNSGRVEVEELSPDFFPGTVKNDQHRGVNFHGCFFMPLCGATFDENIVPPRTRGDFRGVSGPTLPKPVGTMP